MPFVFGLSLWLIIWIGRPHLSYNSHPYKIEFSCQVDCHWCYVTSQSRFRLGYVKIYAIKSEFGIMYSLNHSQDFIELIKKLRGFGAEYPSELLSARRASFISLLSRYVMALVRT